MKEEDFAISVATWKAELDADEAGGAAHPHGGCGADAFCCRRCWRISPRASAGCGAAAMAVVALGKAGGREMMAGSDLDLMFIYDHPPDVTESRAPGRWR